MDLRFSKAENAFREEVREFMRTALPEPMRRKMVEGHQNSMSPPTSIRSFG